MRMPVWAYVWHMLTGMSSTASVPRLEQPDLPAFQEFVRRGQPVVITGAMNDWPAMTRWSLEYFAEHLGNEKVQALTMPDERELDGQTEVQRLQQVRGARMTMHEYLERLSGPEVCPFYVAALPIRKHLPKLLDDIETPRYFGGSGSASPRLWFGAGVNGPLHYDKTHNLHGIVAGEKRFLFADPGQSSKLYPNAVFSGMPHMSRTSFRRPEHDRFPRLRKAEPVEVPLEKGDLLFVPRGWWHEVATPTPTISIDFPWDGGPSWSWMLLRLAPSAWTSQRRRRRQSRTA